MQYLAKNLKYPEKAHAEGVQGMVVVKFDVLEDGSITNVHELPTRTNHPDLVAEAIRAVSAMPKWRPAVKDGKITKTEFTLPIKFALELAKPLELSEVSKAPEFTGGQDGMMEFLVKNIQYPADARKEGAEGLVVIKFVVEKDGTLSSFETLRTPRPDLEAEALRVLRLMPPFDPALKEGKPVPTWYTLPIRFKL
jgi:TonB family protein